MGLSYKGNIILPKGSFKIKKSQITDPYWNNVTLLMTMNDNILDYSNTHNYTLYSTLTYVDGKFGKAMPFAGVGNSDGSNYIISDYYSDSVVGVDDSTIEMWVKTDLTPPFAAASLLLAEIGNRNSWAEDGVSFFLHSNDNGTLSVKWNNNLTYGSVDITQDILYSDLYDGNWHHIAYVKSGNVGMIFIDGIKVYSINIADNSLRTITVNKTLTIGNIIIPTNTSILRESIFDIDSVRITKGIARYTESFTPPTVEFPIG